MAIVDLGQFFDFDKIIAKSEGLIDVNILLDESYEELIKRGKEVSSALNKSLSDITKQSDELAKSLSKGNKTQEEYLESLSKTKKESDSLVDTYKAVDKELKKVEKSTSELEKDQKEVNKAFAEATREARELEKLSDRLAKANSDQAKSEALLKAQINQKNAELRKSAKEALESSNAFKDLTARTNRAQMRFKTLSAELQEAEINFGKNSQEVRRLAQQVDRAEKEFNELDGRLRTINERARDGRRDVGRYGIAFDNVKGANRIIQNLSLRFAALGAAILGAIRTVGVLVSTFKEFQDANATLRGILRATRAETAQLVNQQRQLGESTEFSATQVAKAQIELARLGATQQEIIDLTPGILGAATTLGVELAQASELVAGQLNAFNLEASESGRVADALARSTQISALNFQRLETALGIVSPAANAVNVSLERQLAILGAAVDANIDASSAATALRNIFIDLSDKGLTWEDAVTQINGSTNRLTAANDLFGKRGAVVASVIANNTEKIDQNTVALENAAGTAKAFADNQLDTLTGDIKILTSAWEGFLLSIESGDGFIARLVRGSLQGLTKLISGITPELLEANSALEVQRVRFNSLIGVLTELNPEKEEERRIINQLNTEYGEYLPFIIDETTSKEQLRDIQREVNDELINTILLREQEEELAKISENQVKLATKINELLIEQSRLERENNDLRDASNVRAFTGALEDLTEEQVKANTQAIINAKNSEINISVNKSRIDQIKEEVTNLRGQIQSAGTLNEIITERAKALREILGLQEKQAKANRRNIIGDGARAKSIEEQSKRESTILEEVDNNRRRNQERLQNERLRSTLEFIDRQFELERNQIELTDKTEEEKTQLVLKAERKKLQARLRALQLLGDITRQEADIIKSEIDLVNKEIEESGRGLLGGLLFILENVGQRAIKLASNISAISEGIAERERQRDEQRLNEIEQNRERQIEIAGDNQEAISRINARADKQEEQIQERQRARQIRIAKRQKALAISQSIIDTAVAVVGALKNPPGPPFTIPFAVAAGALGATQTAAISAQPLPAFEKGGIVTEDRPLIWNERGYEYAVTPEGRLVKSQGQGAQITNDIPKGSVILNHAISKQLDKDLSIEKRYKSMPEETKGILKYIQQEKESIAIKMAHSLKIENEALLEEIHALVGAVPSKIELGVRKGELHGWVVGVNKANSERKKGYRYGNKG